MEVVGSTRAYGDEVVGDWRCRMEVRELIAMELLEIGDVEFMAMELLEIGDVGGVVRKSRKS